MGRLCVRSGPPGASLREFGMPRRAVQVLMKTFSRSMLMASRSEASMPLVRMQGDSIPTHTICTLLKAQLHRGPLTAENSLLSIS